MKNWFLAGGMFVLVLIVVGCEKVPQSGDVPISAKYPEKIVYTTDSNADVNLLKADCDQRGGKFDQCGSICAPGAAVCPEVCAFTCKLVEDSGDDEDVDVDGDDEENVVDDGLGVDEEDNNDDSGADENLPEANIKVTSPTAGAVIGAKLEVAGEARVFESSVNYRLKDSAGTVLAEGVVIADASDIGQFGPFEISTEYEEPATTEGVLEVFTLSAKDGSEIDKVTLKVKFS